MAELTQKQEAFAVAYIASGNASDAYRQAYNSGGMAAATVNRKAKELMDNGKITARIEELRKPVAEAAQLTLGKHMDDLLELRNMAKSEGKLDAAIKAEIARGKAAGLYSEKVELTGADGGAIRTEEVGKGFGALAALIEKGRAVARTGKAIDARGKHE
jgi:phage terminase small subunit